LVTEPTRERIAVVTASKGIGLETARKLAAAGLKTIVCSRNEQSGEAAARQANLLFRKLDISDSGSIQSFITSFEEEFGHCDVLVNSAGIAFKAADPMPHAQQARPTFETNYFGTAGFTLAMLPALRKGSSPRIVTIASKSGALHIMKDAEKVKRVTGAALTVDDVTRLANEYIRAAEAGQQEEEGWPGSHLGMSQLCKIAFTNALSRQEAANNIAVNACCPGHCRTDMSSNSGSKSAEEGARTPAWVALMESQDGSPLPSGKFFSAELSYTESQDGEHPSRVFQIQW